MPVGAGVPAKEPTRSIPLFFTLETLRGTSAGHMGRLFKWQVVDPRRSRPDCLLILHSSRPKVRAERPCWKRSIRLKY